MSSLTRLDGLGAVSTGLFSKTEKGTLKFFTGEKFQKYFTMFDYLLIDPACYSPSSHVPANVCKSLEACLSLAQDDAANGCGKPLAIATCCDAFPVQRRCDTFPVAASSV